MLKHTIPHSKILGDGSLYLFQRPHLALLSTPFPFPGEGEIFGPLFRYFCSFSSPLPLYVPLSFLFPHVLSCSLSLSPLSPPLPVYSPLPSPAESTPFPFPSLLSSPAFTLPSPYLYLLNPSSCAPLLSPAAFTFPLTFTCLIHPLSFSCLSRLYSSLSSTSACWIHPLPLCSTPGPLLPLPFLPLTFTCWIHPFPSPLLSSPAFSSSPLYLRLLISSPQCHSELNQQNSIKFCVFRKEILS